MIVGGIVLLGGAIFGGRQYVWGLSHVRTDDAYLAGNVVNVSPTIGGTLRSLTVAEGDTVAAGQLLGRLDDDAQQAALRQAEAALSVARSQVPQAEATLSYQRQSVDAALRRAEAAGAIQNARTQSAQASVTLASQTSRSQIEQARRQVAASRAQAEQARAQVIAVEETRIGYERAVDTARKGVDVLLARLPAARADVEKTSADDARYRSLLAKEAVTPQQADAVRAQAESARSALAAWERQVEQAQAQVRQAQAQALQGAAQVLAARRAAVAAAEQVAVVQAGVRLAQAGGAQVTVLAGNLAATAAQQPQTASDIDAARAGQAQVALRQEQVRAARAQIQQAQAQLTNARVALRNTNLSAPASGTVIKKTVNVGVALAPGQTVLTLTQGDALWVTANFKETQVRDLRIGQRVEIEVDALPGQVLPGRVAVIGAATGATVSLLPPDNATGNFTKVVQRIPVRIALTRASGISDALYQRLRQGMSCVATIETGDKSEHPEQVPAGWNGVRR
jgi:membrane fusion protein (multidrug efflux system)